MRFWHDYWCNDQPFKDAFLVLYDIAIDRKAFVESSLVRQRVGERRTWDVRFFCAFKNLELELVVDFFLYFLV